jgi:hypothetical protein
MPKVVIGSRASMMIDTINITPTIEKTLLGTEGKTHDAE